MPVNRKVQLPDYRSDAWWMKVLDGDLTSEERDLWETHLRECTVCSQEWAAVAQVDMMLSVTPKQPALSEDFTTNTVDIVIRKQRLRRILGFLGGILIVALVAGCLISLLGSVFSSLERTALALYSARHLLFGALVRTVVGLVSAWELLIPVVVLFSTLGFLLLMPNSVVATIALYWFSQRRRAERAVVA